MEFTPIPAADSSKDIQKSIKSDHVYLETLKITNEHKIEIANIIPTVKPPPLAV
jgi:hypothetical protein